MKTYHFQFDEPGIAKVLKGLQELPYKESAAMIHEIQAAMNRPEALEPPTTTAEPVELPDAPSES